MPAVLGRRSSAATRQRRRQPNRYRQVLQIPGAAKFFLGAAPGRVGIAMTSLGVVWMIHWSSGSFGAAGVVAGALAAAEAGVGPQVARLIDRFGQVRILPIPLAVCGISVALLVTLATNHCPLWTLTVTGAFVGGSMPQLGALTSARWTWLLGGTTMLSSAFALESLTNGVAYFVGPTLVGLVSATVSPVAGPILAAVMVIGGGCALIVQRRTAPPPAGCSSTTAPRTTLLHRRFGVLVALSVCIGVFFGAIQVSVTAFAIEHSVPEAAGPLLSIGSGAGLVAGLAYGLRRWRAGPSSQLARVLVLLTVGCVPLLAVTDVPALAGALVVPGLLIPPVLILTAILTEALVDRSVLTQAFAWQASASAGGTAAAAALTGQLIDTYGARYGFLVMVVAITAAAVLVAVTRTDLRRPEAG